MKLVEYKQFKQEFQKSFTSWIDGTITLENGKVYSIRDIDGKVFVELGKKLTNKQERINTINNPRNKRLLKNCEYDFDGDIYYIIGIGYESIKAIKNNSKEEKYYRYNHLEGEFLLNRLSKVIGQITLI